MTPAEVVAANKPPRKAPQRRAKSRRAVVWACKVREARSSLRLSLDDVAKAVGLSKPGLWQIEQGSDVMLTTARRLAMFFGKTVEELWEEEK